ncbi:siderophore-interacting protein [Rhodococcus sp. 1.20]|uniref:siderophore-interacting protein n=1 Tax=Rhodococcus TaxID=1827 RepID=UPI00067F12CB|nr:MULTISPECIES: siderophore-interacting protein [Rhodococcus]AUS31805.1 siderophore-interacting protein [Rhodococcus qingshengii]MCC4304283.1 siderophore-interacting protein [Rhodococcus sp. 3-2]MDI9945482.1 siderophore-interacting protein [Rhodococcus sp. IEGM 1302]OMQ36660.1 NADPH-dependent ferric siderophore reductase [Rhodococcus sp. D-1]QEM27727.1 siderophore-interacting protein [Rhodococcus qingshengii]
MSVVETPPKDEAPRHEATVTRTQQVTPLMRRITFGGEGLSDFETSGSPDERVLVRFPLDPPHARSYTVRRWQPSKNELEIDFVLHGHGGAALWAATAQPGETVHLSTTSGWFTPPAGCDWLLMVADHAALPAIGRILEEAPDGLPIHVIAQVPAPSEQQTFTTRADAHYRWIEESDSLLAELADAALPPGEGYIWCAVEAATARRIRAHLRRTWEIPAPRMHVMGYWREDKENWERRYAVVADRIDAAMGEAMMAGKDFEAVRDAVDDAMEREGL